MSDPSEILRHELHELHELLRQSTEVDEADLGPLAVSLAEAVLALARTRETAGERAHRRTLGSLLRSPRAALLTLALTDRAYRATGTSRALSAIVEALDRIGIAESLPGGDRLLLRLLSTFGRALPTFALTRVKARLAREAEPFVLDASSPALERRLMKLRATGPRINLNQLGEEVLGEASASEHVSGYLALLDRGDIDAISVKLSAVVSQASVLAFEHVVHLGVERLLPVVKKAEERERLVYFDMEAYRDLEMTVALFSRLALHPGLERARLGIALQAYLPDTNDVANRLIRLADERTKAGGSPLRLRLVKGANLAAESVEASRAGLALPIFGTKAEVDANYKRLLHRLVRKEHVATLRLGVGSHNLFDQSYALVLAAHRQARELVELEMLEGMAGSTGRVLHELSGALMLYTPAVVPAEFPAAIAYLVRRLDENTSPENFLARSATMMPGDPAFLAERDKFLRALESAKAPCPATFRLQDRTALPALTVRGGVSPFENAADTDFTRAAHRRQFAEALRVARTSQPTVLLSIGGSDREATRCAGFDPSAPGETAYFVHLAGEGDVELALRTAEAARPLLGKLPLAARALFVDRAADELEKARAELVALMVKDAGKRVEEADVEVSEAIDFARYYSRSALAWAERYELAPRGVTVVAPPWNFPLAIPLGGCFAALLGGNPVIVKPAPETPLVLRAGIDACYRAGIPTDALQFVPTTDDVASRLIVDERVRTVVLTGATSTARLFLRMRPGLHLLAETGGKNAAFVSALSDRDAAIQHVVKSAFGHAGQKCSALSLLVLEDEVYEDARFLRTLVDAAASLVVGSAYAPETFVTPLIRAPEGPLRRVLTAGSEPATWALEPRVSVDQPALVSPGILRGVVAGSFAHQTEFFGPVLSLLRARDLEHGLQLMNGTPYGLTAGFFGLSEREQVRFVEGMDAGNLYVNRAITGAVVGRQPFGGRKDSNFGPGAKAGGPNYVLQFCHVTPKTPKNAKIVPWGSAQGDGSQPGLFADVPGTTVVGEANWLRYQPAPTLLTLGDGATLDDEACARRGAARVGATLVDLPTDTTAWRATLERTGIRRVRVLGRPSEAFVVFAGESGLSLLDGPTFEDDEFEARNYVLEQSISIAYHRYGNGSLCAIHPLLQGPTRP